MNTLGELNIEGVEELESVEGITFPKALAAVELLDVEEIGTILNSNMLIFKK